MAGIASETSFLAMTGNSCGLLVIASEQRERGNPLHEKGVATLLAPCLRLPRSLRSFAMTFILSAEIAALVNSLAMTWA